VPGTPQEERSENSVNTSIVAVKLYSMKLERNGKERLSCHNARSLE
jgi:hypothetical protein